MSRSIQSPEIFVGIMALQLMKETGAISHSAAEHDSSSDEQEFAIQWENGDLDAGYWSKEAADKDAAKCRIDNESWTIVEIDWDEQGDIHVIGNS